MRPNSTPNNRCSFGLTYRDGLFWIVPNIPAWTMARLEISYILGRVRRPYGLLRDGNSNRPLLGNNFKVCFEILACLTTTGYETSTYRDDKPSHNKRTNDIWRWTELPSLILVVCPLITTPYTGGNLEPCRERS